MRVTLKFETKVFLHENREERIPPGLNFIRHCRIVGAFDISYIANKQINIDKQLKMNLINLSYYSIMFDILHIYISVLQNIQLN